jgi:DNA repair exonuclease SbcCD ATPase subunit
MEVKMLIEKSKELASKIKSLKEIKVNSADASAFHTRAEQIGPSSQQMEGLVQIYKEFRKRNIAVKVEIGKIRELQSKLNDVLDKYQQDNSSIKNADAKLRYTFWGQLKSLPDEIAQSLMWAWEDYINQKIPTVTVELLQTLEHIPSFAGNVAMIRKRMQEAVNMRSSLPQSAIAFEAIDNLEKDIKESWEQLHSEDFPDPVLRFIQAASSRNATLQLVTLEVREWLERHSLLNVFKVYL